MRRYAAEAIGTFLMVFVGTGAIVVDEMSQGAISHLGVALSFGLIVTTMIYALGEVSGAHMNPAVTIGFWIARRFPLRRVTPYIAAQCLGALLASLALRSILTSQSDLGATFPSAGAAQSFVLEVIITFILMFVILGVATGSKETGIMAGVAVGSTVAMCALFAGPITGASMNPARSIGPALVIGNLSHLWIYLAAPVLGAALAVLGCRCVRPRGCCSGGC